MLSFRLYFLMTALWFGNLCKGKYVKGGIQFRISETEFNKVASVLLQPQDAYRVNVRDSKVQGMYNGSSYEITDLDKKSNLHMVHVQVPADDKLVATTFSSVIQQSGKLKLTRLNGTEVIFDGQFDVTLENVTIKYSGLSHILRQAVPSNRLLPLDFLNCSARIEILSVNNESLQHSRIQATHEDWKEIFQNAVYSANFSIGFGESEISFTIFDTPISIRTEATELDIKSKHIMITHKVKKSFKGEEKTPYVAHPPPTLPPPDASSQPFEIVLQADVLNELFREFKQALGVGVKKMTIEKLLPNLKTIAELDTKGFYMNALFPPVSKKYPNAVGRMVLSDVDIYFTIKKGSVQMHFDITSTLAVTLNCDKNRTYTAFNFTMNLYFPTQNGYDNKYLTLKVLNFGGNFTVLNSTIGHIMDRESINLLYAAPHYLSAKLDEFNGMIEGIPLNDILPGGVFALVKSVSVKENSVVVGGNLSPTDPLLSKTKKNQIKWAGRIPEEDLFLKGRDLTPENPEGFQLKEEDCKTPPAKASSACSVKVQTVFLCFLILILNIW